MTPPDWNAGATLAMTGNDRDADQRPEEMPAYGFFDSPAAELPSFVWW